MEGAREKEMERVKTGEACGRDLGEGFSQMRVHKDTHASRCAVTQTNQPFLGMSICSFGVGAL